MIDQVAGKQAPQKSTSDKLDGDQTVFFLPKINQAQAGQRDAHVFLSQQQQCQGWPKEFFLVAFQKVSQPSQQADT